MKTSKFVPVNSKKKHWNAERLAKFLSKRLIGQELAIDRIVTSFNLFLSPIKDPETPIFCGLLLGGTGSGKTLTAELLAEFFFNRKDRLTKILGPEYAENHLISELTGSSHSYIGYDDPPVFSQNRINKPAIESRFEIAHRKNPRVRELSKDIHGIDRTLSSMSANDPNRKEMLYHRNQVFASLNIQIENMFGNEPLYSVILIDEIEKSSRALWNILLEISSKGTISIKGSRGVAGITSFRNSFVILTSNIASDKFEKMAKGGSSRIGFSANETSDSANNEWHTALEELRKLLPPELINRLEDNTIVYHRLSSGQLNKVLDLELGEVSDLLWKSHGVAMTMTQAFRNFISESIMRRQEYGGRQARKRVKKYVREIVAGPLASGEILQGDIICLDVYKGQVVVMRDANRIVIPENILGGGNLGNESDLSSYQPQPDDTDDVFEDDNDD